MMRTNTYHHCSAPMQNRNTHNTSSTENTYTNVCWKCKKINTHNTTPLQLNTHKHSVIPQDLLTNGVACARTLDLSHVRGTNHRNMGLPPHYMRW